MKEQTHFTTNGDSRKKIWEQIRRQMGRKAKWLAAYEDMSRWYADNQGRGLICAGTCGLGKTLICKDVLPELFRQDFGEQLQLKSMNATEMNMRIDELLDFCQERHIIIIDDLGTENIEAWANFTKRRPFCELVNAAEQNGTMLIVTTNLLPCTVRLKEDGTFGRKGDPDPRYARFMSIEQRYGIPTLDRLRAITKVILFHGESMRPAG